MKDGINKWKKWDITVALARMSLQLIKGQEQKAYQGACQETYSNLKGHAGISGKY